jgi:hypothetical protein
MCQPNDMVAAQTVTEAYTSVEGSPFILTGDTWRAYMADGQCGIDDPVGSIHVEPTYVCPLGYRDDGEDHPTVGD